MNIQDKTTENYLTNLHDYMIGLGYRKYIQCHKNESFAYWKSIDDKYQTGLLVYDFTKYDVKETDRYGLSFECMPKNIDCRIDLTVSKDIGIIEFEDMAKSFYDVMEKYTK